MNRPTKTCPYCWSQSDPADILMYGMCRDCDARKNPPPRYKIVRLIVGLYDGITVEQVR